MIPLIPQRLLEGCCYFLEATRCLLVVLGGFWMLTLCLMEQPFYVLCVSTCDKGIQEARGMVEPNGKCSAEFPSVARGWGKDHGRTVKQQAAHHEAHAQHE